MLRSLLLCSAALAQRVAVSTTDAPGIDGASQGILFKPSGWLSTSLQLGMDPKTGKLVDGGAGPQTTQALKNIQAVFGAAGMQINASATSCYLYLANIDTDFDAASAAYKAFFPSEPHPCRSPPGQQLGLEGALAGVHCWGYTGKRIKIAPPSFFTSDFNSQGIVADALLYTAGQVGADPVTGKIVTGGAASETKQALSNLQTVFATAFPDAGAQALAQRATDCQVMVGEGASNWQAVEGAVENYFSVASPAISYRTINVGGGNVEIACSGANSSTTRRIITTTIPGVQGVVTQTPAYAYLQAVAQIGVNPNTGHLVPGGVTEEIKQALQNVEDVFEKAYNTKMKNVATECFVMATTTSDLAQALSAYASFVQGWSPLPVLVSSISTALPKKAATSVQCYGMAAGH